MNIPNEIKIGWKTYKVIQDEHKSNNEGAALYGEIDYCKGEIYLWNKQDKEEMCVTLLHEILHAIFYGTGHREKNSDEDLQTVLSQSIYQVIKDNPTIFKE